MCDYVVNTAASLLEFVPRSFKTLKMCMMAVKNDTNVFKHIPDEFKTGEMCEFVIMSKNIEVFDFLPENYKINLIGTIEYSENFECAICLDGECSYNCIKLYNCKHLFHSNCISTWIKHGISTCPICRSDITVNGLPNP